MSEFYASPRLYLQAATTSADLICRIDAIIDQMVISAAAGAVNDMTEEYSLNDGQTIIHETRRSVGDLAKSIEKLEAIRQIYVNRFNGRVVRLVDHESTRLLFTSI